MTNPNIAVKDAWVEAVLSGNTAAVAALVDPEFTLHQPRGLAYAGLYRGVEGFFDFFARFVATYEIEHLENVATFIGDDPDVIVLQFAFRGVMKATGEKFDASEFESWRFRDGKVLEIKTYWFEMPRLP